MNFFFFKVKTLSINYVSFRADLDHIAPCFSFFWKKKDKRKLKSF